MAIKDLDTWDALYDKYSPIMYGTILGLSDSKDLAEEILIIAFLKFKEVAISASTNNLQLINIIRHTITTAVQHLHSKGIKPKIWEAKLPGFPLLEMLLFFADSKKQITKITSMNDGDIRLQFKEEIKSLRLKLPISKELEPHSDFKDNFVQGKPPISQS